MFGGCVGRREGGIVSAFCGVLTSIFAISLRMTSISSGLLSQGFLTTIFSRRFTLTIRCLPTQEEEKRQRQDYKLYD